MALIQVAGTEISSRSKARAVQGAGRWWSWILSLAVLATAWWALAPPTLGGGTSYVITDGTSMLPHFRAGDLVVLRKQSQYHVGEVAGYHNGELGVVVMHRIKSITNGHYIFKGDNNTFVDTFEPTKSQIVGGQWLHLTGAGRFVQNLHNPIVAALMLGFLWVVSFSPRRMSRRQRRRYRHAR